MNCEEIEIPVPWGHVAAKLWGNRNDPPILVTHGILDNAGSFDNLMPLLPKTFLYICIDLPGHGRSSHFPPFFPVYTLNYIPVYKLIMQYFNNDKWTIIGHSYGGQIAFTFAQIYPDLVERLILLDCLHLFPIDPDRFADYTKTSFDRCIELENKLKAQNQPSYSYEEALTRICERRQGSSIRRQDAENLAKRVLIPAQEEGKFHFAYDQRNKIIWNPLHDFRYIIETLKKNPVTCPVLILLGTDSLLQQKYFETYINFIKELPNIQLTHVKGNHDVHSNNPECVAPTIAKFLLSVINKL